MQLLVSPGKPRHLPVCRQRRPLTVVVSVLCSRLILASRLVFAPAGAPSGCDELVGNSVVIRVGELGVESASIEDVLRSKEEAGRDKDVRGAAVLKAFLRERRRAERAACQRGQGEQGHGSVSFRVLRGVGAPPTAFRPARLHPNRSWSWRDSNRPRRKCVYRRQGHCPLNRDNAVSISHRQ